MDKAIRSTHASLLQTVCYDDLCLIYKADKDGSGQYLKKPKGRRVVAMLERTMIKEDDGNYLVSNSIDTDEAKEWE